MKPDTKPIAICQKCGTLCLYGCVYLNGQVLCRDCALKVKEGKDNG